MNIIKNDKIENTYIINFDSLSEYFSICNYMDKNEIQWKVNKFNLTLDSASIIISTDELDRYYNLGE